MNLENFEKNIKRMCQRFNRKPTEDLLAVYFERLDYIEDDPFAKICDSFIDESRFFPTPQEIKNRYWQYQKDHPETSMRRYDPNESLSDYYQRVTVITLWAGLKILERQGEDAFQAYCNKYHISEGDIDSIRLRLRVSSRQPSN